MVAEGSRCPAEAGEMRWAGPWSGMNASKTLSTSVVIVNESTGSRGIRKRCSDIGFQFRRAATAQQLGRHQRRGGPVPQSAWVAARGGGLFGYGFDESLDVAVGKGSATVAPGGVLVGLGDVGVDEEAVGNDVVVDLHRLVHIDVARCYEL